MRHRLFHAATGPVLTAQGGWSRKHGLTGSPSWHRCLLGALVLIMLMAPTVSFAAPVSTTVNPANTAVQAASADEAPLRATYIVQRGDTLAKIAARNGTTVASLMALNHLRSANFIYVGQPLVISGGTRALASKNTGKYIDINLSQQRLRAYQNGKLVLSALISSGVAGHRTPVGRFAVRTKVRAQTMSGPGYWLPNVQWVMYFVGANAIHGTYWHHNFGRPMSHGCINMTNANARYLYNWAPIGTSVVTHY